jgi:putative glutamine amidotransferase
MSKLICFSPRLLTEQHVEKQFVNTRYIDRMTERGFNTLLLTLNNPKNEEIFKLCDGFIITGGDDIDPSSYGESNEGLSINTHRHMDDFDLEIIDYAIKTHKPLLGICRGQQMLNVALGGTLHQDLGQLNASHHEVHTSHLINMKQHPLFSWGSQVTVNSYHHQAIKDLSHDLEVFGEHDDGTIEMVFHKKLPIFAVQWHPEITPDSPYSKIVFDAFSKLVNQTNT